MAFEGISSDEKEELLEGVLNNAYHGIVVLDSVRDPSGAVKDFVYIYVNQKAEAILEKNQSELIGKGLLEVFPGVKKEGILDKYLEVLENGVSHNFDHFYDRDGLTANFQVSMNKFRDGVMVSFVETTEQINQARQLKILSERLDLATSAAKVGVWEFDLLTEKLIWDDAMFRIYDMHPDEFGGVLDEWTKRVHPDDIAAANANFLSSRNPNSDIYSKFRIVLKDGSIRWIDARARLKRNDAGEPVAIVGTNWDITDLVSAYETLEKAKEQADRANAAKSEFLAVMSHELRTPLNPIIGCTDLLKEQIKDPADLKLLNMIEQCGHNLLALITDILDFCTLNEGKFALSPVPVDIHETTQNLCQQFSSQAEAKGLELTLSISDQLPREILIDPKRYQQIIRNLVSNAIKFTDQGSVRLVLSAQTGEAEERALVVTCRDTGIGIPEERTEFIFERFTQLDASNTRKEGGTGLGLAICRRLCDLMGGQISVASELGKGTEFKVELPLHPCDEEPESNQLAEPQVELGDQTRRVLIIDDDISNLFYLEKVMEHSGMQSKVVSDPKEGEALALSTAYDIIFLDLHMPGLSGTDIVQEIRRSSGPNRDVPLVAVTADVRPEQQAACLDHGFSRVLKKPVKPNQLREAIAECGKGGKRKK